MARSLIPTRPTLPRRTRGRVVSPSTPPEELTARAEVIETDTLRWIHIEKPTAADRAWLQERFPTFHALDYEDIMSRNQRPKVDTYDDYLFIVLHFPQYDKTVGRLNGVELDMFVGPDYVITLPNDPIQPLSYLFDRCQRKDQVRQELMGRGAGYLLYKLVDACVDASFPMLRKIGNKLERVEEEIFDAPSKDTVRDISNAKQEIINFRKVVRPQRLALKDLERTKRYVTGEMDIYFDDINDASERIWDMLENFKEVAEALERTHEAVSSHRTNDVLLVLTSISVIVLPLTLVASVFGMNTGLPGQGKIGAFWVIVGLMVVLLIAMVRVFRKRGWL